MPTGVGVPNPQPQPAPGTPGAQPAPTPQQQGQGWMSYNPNTGMRTDTQTGWVRPNYTNGQTYGGINPTDVQNPTPNWADFNRFSDATYADATRRLDPMWQQNEARFNQDMVNRGIAQGSEAYTAARADFDRGRNDAYSQAQRASLADALGAQQQFWQQNYGESELANRLATAAVGADAAITGANISAGASRYGNDINRQNFTDNLGFQRERADMADLMGLLGYGNDITGYNNGLLNQDYSRGADFMGLIPGVNPTQLDVMGPINQASQAGYNNSLNQYNANQARNNQYAQIIGWMVCSREVKEPTGTVDNRRVLDAMCAIPVETWKYHHAEPEHIGTYAEDFNRAIFGKPAPVIQTLDFLGALLSSVQQLAADNRALMARLDQLEARAHA